MLEEKKIRLFTDGPGIVLYSPGNMTGISEGEDYFSKEFSSPGQVSGHIQRGDIIGFNTGSSGEYIIKSREGYPSEEVLQEYPIALRLVLDVRGGEVAVIDLLWLSEWSDIVPDEQKLKLTDGIYHVTVLTKRPASGTWGDNQDILLYFNQINEMPEMTWKGVPYLFR